MSARRKGLTEAEAYEYLRYLQDVSPDQSENDESDSESLISDKDYMPDANVTHSDDDSLDSDNEDSFSEIPCSTDPGPSHGGNISARKRTRKSLLEKDISTDQQPTVSSSKRKYIIYKPTVFTLY